ncbi:VOC family protein [Demequina sp. SYSU T00192]|uniref:VOC family protein n=1 Tax=Demequina litoralis TaxID=3051660 RepID=A0ABT8G9T7_9MICO|nr:VOC family protein [Demequina sp. SYSU T00192]MDN4475905.1 VOC family protein [Demequina sp. SYSU T00192]
MDWKLEVVVVPVSDVDRARDWYRDRMGFVLDHDQEVGPGRRIVQLTPPGSACSIVFGTEIGAGEPGSLQGVQLVVDDIEAAREELLGRGFDPGEPAVMAPGDGGTFLFFADPDGNGWAVQQYRGG